MNDIIIRGARIVDGTGAEARNGDVAITDGIITAVGKVTGSAGRTIEADGALVTPGFIDVHTHYDGQFLWDEELDPSFSNGVTTVIAGNCGVGFAPVRAEHHRALIELMEGVEDIPGIVLEEGLDWQWETFPDYMNRIAARRYSMDVGVQLPHAPLRLYVMGDRAVRHETATVSDVEKMTKLVREAMEAGALGVSAASFRGHRSTKGDYVPGTFSGDDELVAVAKAMAASGSGVFQIVPHGAAGDIMGDPATREERLAEHERFVKIAREANCPVTYALLQFASDSTDWKMMLEATERAHTAGLRIHPQTMARSGGAITTLEGYHPFLLRPSYMKLARLPLAERAAAMRDPAVRAAILSESDALLDAEGNAGTALVIASMNNLLATSYPMSAPLDYEPGPEKSLQTVADRAGKTLHAALYDHLVTASGNQFASTFATNFHNSSLDAAGEMLANPLVISSMGDAGAHVKYVCDGAITSFQLAFWCRDRTRGPRLPVEFMVRKATLDCAALYGLTDRGVIAPGKRADVNVIDFDRLNVKMPRMVHDLPSGGARLLQDGTGYLATLVAGTITRENDEATGTRPGRLIRSSSRH
jgi:N-acyl-D-amino-acid deacylase